MKNNTQLTMYIYRKYAFVFFFVLAFLLLNTNNISAKNIEIDEQEVGVFNDSIVGALTRAEVMPEFPGGRGLMFKFIGENLRYPTMAKQAGASGRLLLRFVVDKTGGIRDVRVVMNQVELKDGGDVAIAIKTVKGKKVEEQIFLTEIKKEFEYEARRMLKRMPKWNAGLQDGKPVDVYVSTPIVFRMH